VSYKVDLWSINKSMFKSKSKSKQSLAQQLKNKLSFSTPIPKDAVPGGRMKDQLTLCMPQIPIPVEESLVKQSLKEKLSSSTTGYVDSYGGFFMEHTVMAEFNHLKKIRLPGVYVIPSFFNPLIWFGVIFIRQGTYEDGVFRFTLDIPNNYPDGDCPTITFTPPVYHPFIDAKSGKLNVSQGFTPWRANVNHIWQVLLYMRRIFYKFDTNDPVNIQAADLYESDIDAFKKKIKENISDINKKLYEDCNMNDPHAFHFREWKPDIHENCTDFVAIKDVDDEGFHVSMSVEKTKLSGLSFLEPGTSTIFSKVS